LFGEAEDAVLDEQKKSKTVRSDGSPSRGVADGTGGEKGV